MSEVQVQTAALLVLINVSLAVVLTLLRAEMRRSTQQIEKALARVEEVTRSNREAELWESAATEWDSVEGQALVLRLSASEYRAGGPSMPAIWLNYKAKQAREASVR